MDTNSRIHSRLEYNSFKALFIVILFTILFIKATVSNAQISSPGFYKGLSASFGVRSFSIKSTIPELNNLQVLEEGGSVGIIFGNEVLQTRVNLGGLYYSAARVSRTINVFEIEGLANYYLLRSLRRKHNNQWDPYIVAGVSQDFIKFYGRYLKQQEGQQINNSTAAEPLLGKISQTRATVGLGLAWRITNDVSFIQLFAEGRYGLPLIATSDHAFKNTTVGNSTSFNVGVNFGFQR